MTPEEEKRRGEEARRILTNPLYAEAWALYDAALLRLLASADIDRAKKAELCDCLSAAHKARAHLERIVNEGKLAAAQIEAEEHRKTFMQRMRRVIV